MPVVGDGSISSKLIESADIETGIKVLNKDTGAIEEEPYERVLIDILDERQKKK